MALDRPLTRFLILADAENNYKTAAGMRRQRRLLLESLSRTSQGFAGRLLRQYPPCTNRRDPDLGQAAFRVRPLHRRGVAGAILAVARTPHPRGRGQLLSDLRHQRGRPTPDVGKVCRWHKSGLSKPILADSLWPVLERKIQTALDCDKPGPPVLRACIRAYEMAAVSEKVRLRNDRSVGKDVHHAKATAVEVPEITWSLVRQPPLRL